MPGPSAREASQSGGRPRLHRGSRRQRRTRGRAKSGTRALTLMTLRPQGRRRSVPNRRQDAACPSAGRRPALLPAGPPCRAALPWERPHLAGTGMRGVSPRVLPKAPMLQDQSSARAVTESGTESGDSPRFLRRSRRQRQTGGSGKPGNRGLSLITPADYPREEPVGATYSRP